MQFSQELEINPQARIARYNRAVSYYYRKDYALARPYAGHECHTFRGGARVIVRLRFDDAVAPGEASWFVNAEISRSATGSLRLVRLEAVAPKNNPGALTARILNARLTSMPVAIPMLFDDALQANLLPRP